MAVDFDLPDGQWTLNVITVSYKGGEKQTEGYLNPLDSAATKVLLDTVYEPIYAHFGEEFGKRCAGSSRMSRGLATSTGRRMPPSATTAP